MFAISLQPQDKYNILIRSFKRNLLETTYLNLMPKNKKIHVQRSIQVKKAH
jgi:hypothetical protein